MICFDLPVFIPLLIASWTDIKRKEIPIWLFPSTIFINILIRVVLHTGGYLNSIIGAAIMGIAVLLLCVFGKSGGGDLIMFSALGFFAGILRLPRYLFCLCVCCLFPVIKMKIKEFVPMAPIAMAAWTLFFLWGIAFPTESMHPDP